MDTAPRMTITLIRKDCPLIEGDTLKGKDCHSSGEQVLVFKISSMENGLLFQFYLSCLPLKREVKTLQSASPFEVYSATLRGMDKLAGEITLVRNVFALF